MSTSIPLRQSLFLQETIVVSGCKVAMEQPGNLLDTSKFWFHKHGFLFYRIKTVVDVQQLQLKIVSIFLNSKQECTNPKI